VKFTPSGGTVSAFRRAGPRWRPRFQNRDTGIGIPEDKIDVALEPFGQIDSKACPQIEGTGLGLPLTRSSWSCMAARSASKAKWARARSSTVRLPNTLNQLEQQLKAAS